MLNEATKDMKDRYRELHFISIIHEINRKTQTMPLTLQYLDWCCNVIGGLDTVQIKNIATHILLQTSKKQLKLYKKEMAVLLTCFGCTVRSIMKQITISSTAYYTALDEYKKGKLIIRTRINDSLRETINNFVAGYTKIEEDYNAGF